MKKLLLFLTTFTCCFFSKVIFAQNLWANGMIGTGAAYSYATAIDDSGTVYTTGSFFGTNDFNPGRGTLLIGMREFTSCNFSQRKIYRQ